MSLWWSADDQFAFGQGLVSKRLVTTAQLDLASEHGRAISVPIGHSLVHIGAITQRQLLTSIERL